MIYQKMLLGAALIFICGVSNGQITPISQAPNPNAAHYMPWKPIAERDIVRKVRIWENIDIKDGNNKAFNAANTTKPLYDALVSGVTTGKIKAYSAADDRLSHEFTPEEFSAELSKTSATKTRITGYSVKEDSLYMNSGEATVRIVSIAPLIATTMPDGSVKEQPVFWIYFPQSRPYLAGCQITGSNSWESIFEGRQFTGVVTRKSENSRPTSASNSTR